LTTIPLERAMKFKELVVPANSKVKLKDYPTDRTDGYGNKEQAAEKLADDISKLADWQAKLYAQNTYALLIILQGIDGAGKDGTIKHVLSGVNPTGCHVKSFKVPSAEELDHDYLWRHVNALPERGNIGIFNRSYYEEVLVVRVHPEYLKRERIPLVSKPEKLWRARYEEINNFERYLVDNGIEILKFFLHLSKEEQKRRFLSRLETPDKNWKFSSADVAERTYWDDYQTAFEEMLSNTSTPHAPWHVIPADRKWFMHMAVADLIVDKLSSLDLHFPEVEGKAKQELAEARKLLEKEK
jgi:PPK2 family polyphosphate:nucleotide phosphotransferase